MIFLLPILALRYTIETIKNTNISEIRSKYQYASQYIEAKSIIDSINELENQDSITRNKTLKIANETERVESDIIYANLTSDFIKELGIQYDRFEKTEKIFIDSMAINRETDFSVKYYNIVQNLLGIYNFSRELKTAYKKNGLSIEENNMKIDFMLIDILQEEITAKTASY
jgi:hypothetical protein